MSQILGVKFNDYGQVYYFASGAFVVREGQHVIVKTDQGMGLGKVVLTKQAPQENEDDEVEGHKTIYRLANEKDLESVAENEALSKDAFQFSRKCVSKHKLGMKLVDVEVFFDRSKMVFYFTAPGRIDFRELIKDLVREYRTRIELRQIGVRHETQMLGAIGNCGQICCCRRFMRKFVPVTIKMAKEQNLFLNPTKISGICGRLLCCLSFEQKGYEEFHRMCPRVGKKYPSSLGPVKVLRSNFFKKSLSLLTESFEEKEVSIDEWNEIVNKPPSEETLAEAEAKAKAQNARGRRPPRRTPWTETVKSTDLNEGDMSEEMAAVLSDDLVEKGTKPERPARAPMAGRSDRQSPATGSGEKSAGDGPGRESRKSRGERPERPRKPGGSGRPGKSAAPAALTDNSGEDADTRSRRPRRRRRRPPKK